MLFKCLNTFEQNTNLTGGLVHTEKSHICEKLKLNEKYFEMIKFVYVQLIKYIVLCKFLILVFIYLE